MNLVIDRRQARPWRELVMKITAIFALHLELPSHHGLMVRLLDFVLRMTPSQIFAIAAGIPAELTNLHPQR